MLNINLRTEFNVSDILFMLLVFVLFLISFFNMLGSCLFPPPLCLLTWLQFSKKTIFIMKLHMTPVVNRLWSQNVISTQKLLLHRSIFRYTYYFFLCRLSRSVIQARGTTNSNILCSNRTLCVIGFIPVLVVTYKNYVYIYNAFYVANASLFFEYYFR